MIKLFWKKIKVYEIIKSTIELVSYQIYLKVSACMKHLIQHI